MIARLAIAAAFVLAAPAQAAPRPGTSARAAAGLVGTYFALIRAHRLEAARQLWGGAGADRRDFAAAFAGYRDYRGVAGAPGQVEGAAGSSYVEVPVRVHGRRRNGESFAARGTITLRRVNDVPGSTLAQRRWHIERSSVEPDFTRG